MPVEVISEIFLLCVPRLASLSRSEAAPLVLGSVCRVWRSIAFSTPKLWSRFQFVIEDLSPSQMTRVKDWFARSGACSLELGIHIRSTKYISDWHHILESTYTRWKDVILFSRKADIQQLSAFSLPFHILRTLLVLFLDNRSAVSSLDLFTNAPMLCKVSISNNGSPPGVLKLPWHQITTLHLTRCSEDGILGILAQCPNVKVCGLREVTFTPLPPSRPRPVLMPQLCKFNIAVDNINSVVDHLVLPALDTLNVEMIHQEHADNFYESLISLFSRSCCPLRILGITHADWVIPGLTPSVLLPPDVVTFKTNSPLSTDNVRELTPQHLGIDEASSFLLPKLETLSLDGGSKTNYPGCVDVTRSRWTLDLGRYRDSGNPRLQSIVLLFSRGFERPEPATSGPVANGRTRRRSV
jgi:hypothetical protein